MRSIESLERELAYDPAFGDPQPILKEVDEVYRFALEVLAPRLEPAAALLEASHRDGGGALLRRPVVRATLNGALTEIADGALAASPVLAATLGEAVDAGAVDPPPDERWEVPLWRDEPHRLAAGLRDLFAHELAGSPLEDVADLRNATPREADLVAEAWATLREVLPDLLRSALAHVEVVAMADSSDPGTGIFESASYDGIPGVVFVSPLALESPEKAAEALFHEALHQKLNDLRFVRPILRPGYDAGASPTIPAIWARETEWNSAQWDADRALAAGHVYLHLGVLFTAFELHRPGSAATVPPASAFARAHYLVTQLSEVAATELESEGRRLVEWMQRLVQNVEDAWYGGALPWPANATAVSEQGRR